MKSQKKNRQTEWAKAIINSYFTALENRMAPSYDHLYIKEINRHAQAFNIRLNREQKFSICKHCGTYQKSGNQLIRLHAQRKTKEFICRNCGSRKRIPYHR